MISIITSTTTNVSMANTMNYSLIVVVFILSFLFLKNIFSVKVQKQRQMRMLVRNFNIVTIPLIQIFIAILTYQIAFFLKF
ncbi:MAG: hypothetical protein Q8N08_05420 [Methanobacteriaceae archaeon]|nr:hypothetical protein [Methanobacteriaceae archaeon]